MMETKGICEVEALPLGFACPPRVLLLTFCDSFKMEKATYGP